MTSEQREFMHSPGEIFCIKQGVSDSKGDIVTTVLAAHKLGRVAIGETPAGTDCEDYIAVCGATGQSWWMNGVGPTTFVSDDEANNAIHCRTCFDEIPDGTFILGKHNSQVPRPDPGV